MRGTCTAPKRSPCHAEDTRTQHELLALRWPIRSQCIWIRMRPYASVHVSSPSGPDHRGGLRAAGARLGLGPLGPEQHVRRLRREGDLATPLLADARRFGHILDLQIGAEDQVLAIGPVLDEMAQPERAAGHHGAHVAASARPAAVLAECLHPQLGEMAAFAPRVVVGGGLAMVAWILIDLLPRRARYRAAPPSAPRDPRLA